MYEIEKDIPMPVVRFQLAKFPYRSMEVGDSFFVEGSKDRVAQMRTKASVNWRDKTGFKFSVRAEPGGCRIWRVA